MRPSHPWHPASKRRLPPSPSRPGAFCRAKCTASLGGALAISYSSRKCGKKTGTLPRLKLRSPSVLTITSLAVVLRSWHSCRAESKISVCQKIEISLDAPRNSSQMFVVTTSRLMFLSVGVWGRAGLQLEFVAAGWSAEDCRLHVRSSLTVQSWTKCSNYRPQKHLVLCFMLVEVLIQFLSCYLPVQCHNHLISSFTSVWCHQLSQTQHTLHKAKLVRPNKSFLNDKARLCHSRSTFVDPFS